MAEKAAIFQGLQVGIESVAGTPVAANRKLLATSFELNPRSDGNAFRAAGNKYASFVTVNKEWTELGMSGRLTFNEILYPLASLISEPTPTQQDATPAYLWSFFSNTSAPDVGRTLTVEQGDADSAWRSAGVQVNGMTFTFNRNEVSFAGNALGEALEKGITLSASPTSLTPLPVLPAQVKFYTASTRTGLAGATAMTRGFSLVWGLTDKSELAWPVGADPFTIEKEPKAGGTLRLASDAAGMGILDNLRNGSTLWFRVEAIGALIQSTYYQKFTLDFPAQVESVPGFGVENSVHVIEYGLTNVHDSTWGRSFQIDIITNVQTL
jgi:hypothetical protein